MANLRRVFFTSQRRIEVFRGRSYYALISITDPGGPRATLDANWGDVLRVSFRDVDPLTSP